MRSPFRKELAFALVGIESHEHVDRAIEHGEDATDYCGILTMLDRAVNLLVAFDSDERERQFFSRWRRRLRGYGESGFAVRMAVLYLLAGLRHA